MEIKQLDDIMNHFYFGFFAYISLFLVILINFSKAFYNRVKIKKGELSSINGGVFEIISSGVCFVGICMGQMFMGVLGDNNALGFHKWNTYLNIISLLSLVFLIITFFLVIRARKNIG